MIKENVEEQSTIERRRPKSVSYVKGKSLTSFEREGDHLKKTGIQRNKNSRV